MRLVIIQFFVIAIFSGQSNIAQTIDPDSLVGLYSGSWTNTTFSSTGGASLDVSLTENGAGMQFILDLDGMVGGLMDPDPRTLNAMVSSSVITIDTSVAEGDLFLTWDANGVIEWDFTNMTTPGFASHYGIGTGTSQEIILDYTVYFSFGDSAVGTAQLTKQVSSVEEEIINSNPDSYKLFNNFPNPFNPSTTIYFSLPEESRVLIKVYNEVGEEFVTLLDEHLSRGIHNVKFDASNLPSGVYLYQMSAGSFTQTNKMVLIK